MNRGIRMSRKKTTKKAKKKNKLKIIIFLLIIIAISLYAGVRLGMYMVSKKYGKPVEDNGIITKAIDGVKSIGEQSSEFSLSEDEIVNVSSFIGKFVSAEHRKKNNILASMVDPDYFNTLTKNAADLSNGNAVVQDISYKEIGKNKVKADVTYSKNSKKGMETITIEKKQDAWKVTNVSR